MHGQVAQNYMDAWALDAVPTTPEVGGPSNWDSLASDHSHSLSRTLTDSLPSQSVVPQGRNDTASAACLILKQLPTPFHS
ncbi:hypothetical protein LMH87_004028 [Akanthomyces muscarius]|uniref:Uncharacterized protein n=1 Tax=Akanthomyces muscarius TaxID=2231603 RepID=A0A9W8UHH9_AKAMU|nr:hypothetical protein LMH87_004028 [Akanthomyces muscarius]KAJ4145170.1 hypothetical protein LMH87_004028 [Akanthomyces muscarius]